MIVGTATEVVIPTCTVRVRGGAATFCDALGTHEVRAVLLLVWVPVCSQHAADLRARGRRVRELPAA